MTLPSVPSVRAPTDLGEKRLENTPDSRVLLENMDKFEKKWQHVDFTPDKETVTLNSVYNPSAQDNTHWSTLQVLGVSKS